MKPGRPCRLYASQTALVIWLAASVSTTAAGPRALRWGARRSKLLASQDGVLARDRGATPGPRPASRRHQLGAAQGLGNADPFADDSSTGRGVVLGRAATKLRSIETQPSTGGSSHAGRRPGEPSSAESREVQESQTRSAPHARVVRKSVVAVRRLHAGCEVCEAGARLG